MSNLAVNYQILAYSYYKSAVHSLEMMELVRDGRSKAKYRRAAVRYQTKAAETYYHAQHLMSK